MAAGDGPSVTSGDRKAAEVPGFAVFRRHREPRVTRVSALSLSLVRLTLVVLVLMGLAGCGASAESSGDQSTQSVQIDGRTFELELALTPEKRYEGLSGREHIDRRGGMLFAFPEAKIQTFVMRGCLVPIDLIYLDGSGRVVRTHQMTVEEDQSSLTQYSSTYPAWFAIELKGGMLDKLDIERGDRIAFPHDPLKQRAE